MKMKRKVIVMQGVYAKMFPDPLISFLEEMFLYEALLFKVAKMCKSKKEVQLVFPVFSGNIL